VVNSTLFIGFWDCMVYIYRGRPSGIEFRVF